MRSWRTTFCFGFLAVMFFKYDAALSDAPFGFEISTHPSQYEFCSPSTTKDAFICVSAPKPHSSFDEYILWYVEGIGLCKTVALGKAVENDAYGERARDQADRIVRQIEKKYGPPTNKFDFLHAGSIWDEPRDWMLALSRNERTYAYAWTEEKGYISVSNVEVIMLEVRGFDRRAGFIRLAFDFGNISRCSSARNEAESDAF